MPVRLLRAGIRTSQTWNETSFSAQSLYISVLTLVDDHGRYDGRVDLLHGECRILRNGSCKRQQTAADLAELHERGLIRLYTVEGKEYLQVLRWEERMRSKSRFPEPPLLSSADNCQQLTAIDSKCPPPTPSPSPSPSPSVPSPSPYVATQTVVWSATSGWQGVEVLKEGFAKAYPACDFERQIAAAEQWLRANPTRARKSDWRKFLTGWFSRSQDKGGDARNKSSPNGSNGSAPQRKMSAFEIEKRVTAITDERNRLLKASDLNPSPELQQEINRLYQVREELRKQLIS